MYQRMEFFKTLINKKAARCPKRSALKKKKIDRRVRIRSALGEYSRD